jgi:hypothetical protein
VIDIDGMYTQLSSMKWRLTLAGSLAAAFRWRPEYTLTKGIVSKAKRQWRRAIGFCGRCIEHDAASGAILAVRWWM